MEHQYPHPSDQPCHHPRDAMSFPPYLWSWQQSPRDVASLKIVQQPRIGRSSVGGLGDKSRQPIDPPPIIQLHVREHWDPERTYHQSPFLFVTCTLVRPENKNAPDSSMATAMLLTGTTTCSLHRLKGLDGVEGAYFVFNDLSASLEGVYQLEFHLFEICARTYGNDPRGEGGVQYHTSVTSDPFKVHGPKLFPGLGASTPLSRHFSEQGLKIRVRKEPRSLFRRRGPTTEDYVSRSCRKQRLRQEETTQKENVKDVNDPDYITPTAESPIDSRCSQAGQSGTMTPSTNQQDLVPHIERLSMEHAEPLSYTQMPFRNRSSPEQAFTKRQRIDHDAHPSQPDASAFELRQTGSVGLQQDLRPCHPYSATQAFPTPAAPSTVYTPAGWPYPYGGGPFQNAHLLYGMEFEMEPQFPVSGGGDIVHFGAMSNYDFNFHVDHGISTDLPDLLHSTGNPYVGAVRMLPPDLPNSTANSSVGAMRILLSNLSNSPANLSTDAMGTPPPVDAFDPPANNLKSGKTSVQEP